MKLVQSLPSGPLDIVGDIHGELDALKNLLSVLGYGTDGSSSTGRKLVFVGDFCDRGPDSPGVIQLVKKLVSTGVATAILGNHEINLLVSDAKDGSGWFFPERYKPDQRYYAPFAVVDDDERASIVDFLNQLPLALERSDLRIVHATWHQEKIDQIRDLETGQIKTLHEGWEAQLHQHAQQIGLLQRYRDEKARWKHQIEDENNPPPFLSAVAEYETLQHVYSPFKVLTSGIEAPTQQPFFSGNRWRYSDRLPWWNDYDDTIPVVIGHYWRLFNPEPDQPQARYSLLFQDVPSTAWHGKHHNVFCIDFSVGARWRNRKENRHPFARFKLAAMQWPEKQLVFDCGTTIPTTNNPPPVS